jgi:hypothetical protein
MSRAVAFDIIEKAVIYEIKNVFLCGRLHNVYGVHG